MLPKPKPRRRVVVVDTEGYTLVGAEKTKASRSTPVVDKEPVGSGTIFDALDGMEDDMMPPPLEEIATPTGGVGTTPDSVMGLWHDIDRLRVVKSPICPMCRRPSIRLRTRWQSCQSHSSSCPC